MADTEDEDMESGDKTEKTSQNAPKTADEAKEPKANEPKPDATNARENVFTPKKESENEYVFDEKEIKDTLLDNDEWKEILQQNKITGKQAKALNDALVENISRLRNEEDLNSSLKERFDNGYKNVYDDFIKTLNQHVTDQGDRSILEQLPNKAIRALVSYTQNLKKSYGADNSTNIKSSPAASLSLEQEYRDNAMKIADFKTPQHLRQQLIERNLGIAGNVKIRY